MTRGRDCSGEAHPNTSRRRLQHSPCQTSVALSFVTKTTTRSRMMTVLLGLLLLTTAKATTSSSSAAASNDAWSRYSVLHYPILSQRPPPPQQHRHTEEVLTNNSLEDDDKIVQVAIRDFQVRLSLRSSDTTSLSLLSTGDSDILTDEMENAMVQEFVLQLTEKDTDVSYVQLIGPVLDVAGTYDTEHATDQKEATADRRQIWSFPGGAAVFEGSYVPSQTKLEEWIQQAVNDRLITNLHTKSSAYDFIQEAMYVSDRVVVTGVQQEVDEGDDDDDNDALLPIVVGAGVGGVVVLALLALLLTKKRRRQQQQRHSALAKDHLDGHEKINHHNTNSNGAVEVTTGDLVTAAAMTTTPTTTDSSPAGATNTTLADDSLDGDSPRQQGLLARQIFPRALTDEAKSVGAGSESSFTVGSEAGDSTGLKSASYQNFDTNAPPPMVAKESFEHERRVTLRKDMLTSTWVGQVNPSQGRPGQIESVLEPSHFTASQERRSPAAAQQRQQQQQAMDAWAGVDSSLRFESASGDDAYLQRNGELV